MKTKILSLFALLVLVTAAHRATAAVEPVVLFINTFITNYTVPTGKVLIIEELSAYAAFNAPAVPRIIVQTRILNIVNNGILTTDWGFPVADKFQAVTLTRPLRIPAHGGLTINPTLGYNEIHFMGLLIDATDLYAANVPGSIDAVSKHGSDLVASLRLTSPRPVRMALSSSPALNNMWAPDSTIQKTRDTDPRNWTITAPVDPVDKFLRISAKAPNQ